MFFRRLLHYLDPRSLRGSSSDNVNLRFMHGINRISLLVFVIALVVMVVRALGR